MQVELAVTTVGPLNSGGNGVGVVHAAGRGTELLGRGRQPGLSIMVPEAGAL